MALSYKLDTIDGLDENIAGLYKQSGDVYLLDVDGLEGDVAGLKQQVESLMTEKKAATKKAKDAEEAARKAAEDAAKKSGDVDALEKSWQQKLDKEKLELQGVIDQLQGSITNMTVDSVAARLANELAVPGSADLLIPHIKTRLSAEQRDGKFVTVIKDSEGKPSASTLDDLKQEFTNNKAFAPVIVGSKATGGGANGGNNGGGASQKTVNRSTFDQMGQAQRASFAKDGGKVIDD